MRDDVHKDLNQSFEVPQLNEAISTHLQTPCSTHNVGRTWNRRSMSSATCLHVTRAALPGAHLVEFFPWMIDIPSRCGVFWKRQ
ncbi:hypothetical protein H4582DRAFT_2004740 [Lactarius indigo]|nr:hypothetical protein H4582DRAFT_2004740 [Lactarius indigo]